MLKWTRARLPGGTIRNLSASDPTRNLAYAEFEADNYAVSRFLHR